jgi:hypothetical protein
MPSSFLQKIKFGPMFVESYKQLDRPSHRLPNSTAWNSCFSPLHCIVQFEKYSIYSHILEMRGITHVFLDVQWSLQLSLQERKYYEFYYSW